MLWDTQRNAAYEKAIARAVEYKREFGCPSILTVDAGAGTGLLGMMAGIVLSWACLVNTDDDYLRLLKFRTKERRQENLLCPSARRILL